TGCDEILELVPNKRLKYASRSGLPVRDYIGIVELAGTNEGGTRIVWRSSFVPKFPGTGALLKRGVQPFLQGCADGLAAYAQQLGGLTGLHGTGEDVRVG